MPERRPPSPALPTEEAKRLAGGQRLKRAIHVGRAKLGMTSDVQVALQAHVSYDTLMNWYGGKTTPRPFELKKVANSLSLSYAELWATYEGTEPEPLPLHEQIRALTVVLKDLVMELRMTRAEQVVATETIVDSLGALGTGRGRAGTRADNGREAPAGTGR